MKHQNVNGRRYLCETCTAFRFSTDRKREVCLEGIHIYHGLAYCEKFRYFGELKVGKAYFLQPLAYNKDLRLDHAIEFEEFLLKPYQKRFSKKYTKRLDLYHPLYTRKRRRVLVSRSFEAGDIVRMHGRGRDKFGIDIAIITGRYSTSNGYGRNYHSRLYVMSGRSAGKYLSIPH